jgi:hypothetical protein
MMARLALLLLPFAGYAQVAQPIPVPETAAVQGFDPKALQERNKELAARIDELDKQLKEKDALNKYLRTQMNFFKAQEEALIVILNGMQDCISKDGMPGFDKTSGDPICQKRQERQK